MTHPVGYPLELTCPTRSYAFGERRIPERLGKTGLGEGRVAETWEVSDYRGAPAEVRTGALAGTPLRALVEHYPDALVGEGWRGPHFPLLAKFLDASHRLPVHLHADDAVAAREYGEPNGKTEAWHVLRAAPDASVLVGVDPAASDAELTAAFLAEDYDRVMRRYPVRAGDTVYVPGGVLHTFGPDTLIFEVQQTSDLARSVMPHDVYGNPLDAATWKRDIAAALGELRREPQPRPHPGLAIETGRNRRTVGCAGPHFALERWRLTEPHHEPAHPRRCLVLTNVGAPVALRWRGGETRLERARSCILPAAIGDVEVAPGDEADPVADLIACYVPDLTRDVVAPLRAEGYDDAAIAALGAVF